jgi:hypothetical protein
MRTRFLHWLAILLILEIGLLHIMTAQAEYEEAAYMGYLFAANFFGAVLAAYAIYHRQVWGWLLGLIIAAGSIAGYIYSRTVGIPGLNVEEWFSPYGVVSSSIEIAYILLFCFRPWRVHDDEPVTAGGAWLRTGSLLLSVLAIVSVSALSYRWDVLVKTNYGHHVGSLSKVCRTPETSFAQLEETYGVQVALVATSMMGSIVDVRLKVVDPDKAHNLLQNQAALLVGQQSLILAPHMHSHTGPRLKAGKIFNVFFPTQKMITPGSQVSLVLGAVRVEPVTVK